MASVHKDAHSDAELLALSREGDSAAFGVLWERHRLAGIVAAKNIAPSLDPDDLVSHAYLKIFELVRDGRGPTGAFRPYLYRVISSNASDAYRSQELTGISMVDIPNLNEAGPWEDGAFDINAAARAFESLPERWQSVLWYSEVEGMAPRQIAPLLGLSANGVSALTARAKEGLQSAWVETHIDMQLTEENCRSTREQLQRYQLGKLTARRSRAVADHLEHCESCAAAAAEFSMLNKQLALVLATILIGSVGAGTLLRSLSFAATSGAAAGSGIAAASADVGTKAGIGTVVTAVATSVTLVAAAVGGVFISQSFEANSSSGAESTTSEVTQTTESEASDYAEADEQQVVTVPDKAQDSQETQSSEPDVKEARDTSGKEEDTPPGDGNGTTPPPPPPPPLTVGVQCYIPDIDTGTFEIFGQANASGSVHITLWTAQGTTALPVLTDAAGSWRTGALPQLEGFVDGSTTGQAYIARWNRTSPPQPLPAAQCGESELTIDTSLEVIDPCYLNPFTLSLSGKLSQPGVLYARLVSGNVILPIIDPVYDGVQDPLNPSVTWFNIFSGSDAAAPYFWWSALPLTGILGTAAEYNDGLNGSFELRIQTADGRSSLWVPLEELVTC